jgi:hypothetical protein
MYLCCGKKNYVAISEFTNYMMLVIYRKMMNGIMYDV